MIFLQSVAATFGVVAVLCLLDDSFTAFVSLVLQGLLLELRKIPMRIRLEWDIFMIKFSRKRHLDMAKQILKDLGKDEQV